MIESVLVQLLILVGSLIVLAFSSHYSIKAIEKIIELTGLSEMSAGFILLATLTSAPEIIVALFSVLQGEPGISIGDILGSNVFNIGAVLGILGMLGYLKTCCTTLFLLRFTVEWSFERNRVLWNTLILAGPGCRSAVFAWAR